MLCRRLGVKDVFLFATEAGAPAWLTLGFEHVAARRRSSTCASTCSSSATAASRALRPRSRRRASQLLDGRALKIFSDSAGLYPMARGLEAAPPAPAPRRRAAASKKRVVDDADADDEDEAWEPGRPSNMDLDDDEQEQAAKAKRKLKRRSKKKSAKAKNAAGAAPHAPVSAPPRRAARPSPRRRSRPRRAQPVPAPAAAAAPPRPLPKIRVFPQLSEEQERNAFLERIQAEEVRREQARIAAARPVPPPPNRATGADDDSDEGWEESDEDDPVEDLIHRERIRERDLLRTPGCLALGRKAFRLEDMPRTAPGRAEVHIKELGFHFIDPLAPIAEKEIVPRPRVHPYLGIEGWISITSRGPAPFSTRPRASFDASRASPDAPMDATGLGAGGPPLKALEAMTAKLSELDARACGRAGVAAIGILRDLVRRLRAGEPAASLKATLVADGAKKVVFQYGRPGNGTDYLVARWRGLAETDPLRLEYAQPECGVRYPYGSKLGLFKGRVGGGVRCFERFASVSSRRVRETRRRFDASARETSAL
ncbi:hypothetical protein JL721_13161 [Aureococcus anophagefferens]|nr:hypothetical protein JL721_13161 [Aureococcus anophagefferens]